MKALVPHCVYFYLRLRVMYNPIQLHNYADFMTIKVDNVAIYWDLSSKFQS